MATNYAKKTKGKKMPGQRKMGAGSQHMVSGLRPSTLKHKIGKR